MGFREWLYNELFEDGVITEDSDIDPEFYEIEDLLTSTDFEAIEVEVYVNLYNDYCKQHGLKPDFDMELPED